MKKRFLSLLLVVAIIASMVVMPVAGETVTNNVVTDNITAVTEQCPCGCGPISQVDWQPYNYNTTKATMGHFYLDGDYAQSAQCDIISGSDMVIDLRGHTLTTEDYHRLFLVYGYLGVLDTVGGGRMQAKTSGGAYGGVVMVAVNETLGATFEFLSGTLTVDEDNKGSLRGGIVSVGKNAVFRMTGGILSGGRTVTKSGYDSQGGGIAAIDAEARVEILGGTIMNCSAVASGGAIYSKGITVLKNCRILNCKTTAYGGNICQIGGSLTMENCEIAYGVATGTYGGGNIYAASSCVFTDTGSVIRDGYAEGGTGNGGGNILFGAGTHTLTGTTIRGGVSRKYGANILNWTSNTTRLIDCNIDGDVRWAGTGLSLEGKTKISLRGNGLNLVGSTAGTVISASKLTEGAEIFVSAHWGKFTNDSVNADYFKPGLRTALSQNTDGTLSGVGTASGEVGGYCPHCYDPAKPQEVTWQVYTASTDSNITRSGHYYLNPSKPVTARLNIMDGADVVIDLNGSNFTSGHRALVLKKGATLSLLDFNGAGKVTGKGGIDWSAGVIYGEGACTLNIYGGTYIYNSNPDKHVKLGGVVYVPAGSQVNIYGGSLDGSAYNKTASGYNGGVIYMADSATGFKMSAGRIVGGNAYQAGSLFLGNNLDVQMTGGVISGGTAASSGGNIRFAGASGAMGTADLQDCAVLDGTTTGAGGYSGNMHLYYYDVDMDNCFIYGGVNQLAYGGNIACSSGSVTEAKNTIFAGGKAPKGGNFYMTTIDLKATFTDCMILDGKTFVPESSTTDTDGYGGNLFINNGVITFEGGVISGGRAERCGGNIHNNAGNAAGGTGNKLVMQKGTDAPQLTGGRAGTYGGNAYLTGVTELQAVYIAGGEAVTSGDDLYLYKGAKTSLTVGAGATGDILMGVAETLLGSGVYGQPVSATTANTLNMAITLEGNYGEPLILAKNGSLCVGAASVVDAAGTETWYADNTSAVAACGADEYVKLYTADDLVLTKNLAVDLNGQTVAVSGDYVLSGMDNTGDAYIVPTGKATFESVDAVKSAEITYAPGGNKYVAVTDGASVSYHRLGMDITDVALRPSNAGIYYKGSWKCDSVLADLVQEYGIAVSTANMPAENFRNEAAAGEEATTDNLWVAYDGKKMNGSVKCGVIISNIFKDGKTAEENQARGEMPVYATAYMTLKNGKTFVSDNPVDDTDDIGYSLHSFMELIDDLIGEDPTNFRRLEKPMKEFYAVWEEKGCGEWLFDRLKAPENPADDGVLNVLMIGSSGCYYYVEELYALLKEAGIESRICNVYYSGGLLSQHYNWWKDGKSNYQFFVTDASGRHKLSNTASLEYCLSFYNWDVITLQESGTGTLRVQDVQTFLSARKLYLDSLYGYLAQEFPQAELMWHENGSYQVGYNKSFQVTSLEDQISDTQNFRKLAQGIAEEYNVRWIPRGEGSLNFRRDSGLPDTLCARLGYGTNHEGDYYHDGDIGGGQLLTACVWFESLTGLSCLDSEYVPVYTYGNENFTLSDELVTAVRAAAHKAVQEWFVTQ